MLGLDFHRNDPASRNAVGNFQVFIKQRAHEELQGLFGAPRIAAQIENESPVFPRMADHGEDGGILKSEKGQLGDHQLIADFRR